MPFSSRGSIQILAGFTPPMETRSVGLQKFVSLVILLYSRCSAARDACDEDALPPTAWAAQSWQPPSRASVGSGRAVGSEP